MKVFKLAALVFLVSVIALGCSKKTEQTTAVSGLGLEGEDKDVVMQTVTSPEVETQLEPQAVSQPVTAQQPIQVEAAATQKTQIIQLAADEIERNKQIQTALKNANLYFGEIDGKAGPLTRKAIEEFQRMKGLKVDGKVGPVTWAELQKYLSTASTKK